MFCLMVLQLHTRTLQFFGLKPDKLVLPLIKPKVNLNLKNNILFQDSIMTFPLVYLIANLSKI